MKYSKTQVIALFLGLASAEGELAHINGPASTDTIPSGQTPITASSGASCTALGGCAAEGESCGRFQRATGDPVDLCVNTTLGCGQIGRIGGVAYSINCWTAVAEGAAETPTAPADVDPAQYMTEIEDLITKTTYNWDGRNDIIVSPKFDFQDGWWYPIEEGATDAGKWLEYDKPADNRCFLDLQCDADHCCAHYPDTNNRRCITNDKHNTEYTFGPIKFNASCASKVTAEEDTGGDPEPAKNDIDSQALADASEALTTWNDNLQKDAKEAAGYDDMSAEDKATWDSEWKAEVDKADEVIKGFRETAGVFDDEACDDACKAVFEADLLEWQKEVYETCKADKEGIACREADALRADVQKNRGKDYYTGSKEDRATADEAQKEKTEALESQLVAAFREENAPAAGTSGGMCSATQLCDTQLCCGNSTPDADQKFATENLENICASALTLKYQDDLGNNYTHVCTGLMATKLFAVAAAAVTAAASLM